MLSPDLSRLAKSLFGNYNDILSWFNNISLCRVCRTFANDISLDESSAIEHILDGVQQITGVKAPVVLVMSASPLLALHSSFSAYHLG